jgi:hypothetical protein
MCKDAMKCFMVKHPNIDEGLILQEVVNRYGVECHIPLLQCFGIFL